MTEGRGNEAGDNVERSGLEPKESLKGESISSTEQNTDHKKVIEDQRSRPESFKSFSDGMPAINPLVLEDSLTGDVFYDAGKRNSAVQADDGSAGTAGGTDVHTGVGDSTDAVSLTESGVGSPDATAGSGSSTVDAILAAAQNQAPPEAGMMQIGGQWYRQDQLVAANVESGFPGHEMRTATDATAALSPAEVQERNSKRLVDEVRNLLPPGATMSVRTGHGANSPLDVGFLGVPPADLPGLSDRVNALLYASGGTPSPAHEAVRRYSQEHPGQPLVSDQHAPAMSKALMELSKFMPPGSSLDLTVQNQPDGSHQLSWGNWKGFDQAHANAFTNAVSRIPNALQALAEFGKEHRTFSSGLLAPQAASLDSVGHKTPAQTHGSSEKESKLHYKAGEPLKGGTNQTDLRPSTSFDVGTSQYETHIKTNDSVSEYLSGKGFVFWNGRQVEVSVSPDAIQPISAQAQDGTPIGVSLRNLEGESQMSAREMHGRLATLNGQRYFVVESVLTKGSGQFRLPPNTMIPLHSETRRSQNKVWTYD